MNKTIGWGVLLASLVGLGAEGAALAQPSNVQIEDLTYSGSGCPAGSVSLSLSEQVGMAVVQFDSLIAQTPPGTIDRKNCQIAVKLRLDPDWSFALRGVNYRGFAALQAGTSGLQKSTYFFQGIPPAGDVSAQTIINGPFRGNYARSDRLGTVWSPCGGTSRTMVINTEVRVQGPEGKMTVDSSSGKVIHEYDLLWRKCS